MEELGIVLGEVNGNIITFKDVSLFLVPNYSFPHFYYKVEINLDTNLMQCFDPIFGDRIPRVTFYYRLKEIEQ